MKNEIETKVLFRMFKAEVLALFPEMASTVGMPQHCESYAHQGQHGGANFRMVMHASRPALPLEYRELAAELRRIGYKLKIVKRATFKGYRQPQLSTRQLSTP